MCDKCKEGWGGGLGTHGQVVFGLEGPELEWLGGRVVELWLLVDLGEVWRWEVARVMACFAVCSLYVVSLVKLRRGGGTYVAADPSVACHAQEEQHHGDIDPVVGQWLAPSCLS
jgi:hypothetical protein